MEILDRVFQALVAGATVTLVLIAAVYAVTGDGTHIEHERSGQFIATMGARAFGVR